MITTINEWKKYESYNGHKIPTNEIFFHNNIHTDGYNTKLNNIIDIYENDETFEQNKQKYINVKDIVPTQKFVTKDNLDKVKKENTYNNTGAYLVEYDNLYYIIDGHHRIANQILEGVDMIKAYIAQSNITESVEFNDNIRFEDLHLNHHNDQHVYKLNAYINDKLVGYVDYHEYRGEIFIDMIESLLPKHNVGSSMMKHLADKYGYENIERTHFTEAGIKLRQKMDDYYNFDYDEYKKSLNKHIDRSEIDKIKNPLVKQFLNDILLFGSKEAWEKNLDKIRNFNDPNLELDFNEIADISEWIKNSPTNNNDPQDEVPDVILNDLQKLK